MKFRKLLLVFALITGVLSLPAAAFASTANHAASDPRCVQHVSIFDGRNGALTTDAMLTNGETLTLVGHTGQQFTVKNYNDRHALNTLTLSPALPLADNGQIVDFTTSC